METPKRIAVLDACVLYPPSLRDFLMWLAVGSVYAMRLTDAIHEEWIRNVLRNQPQVTREKLARTRALMNNIQPDALVTGHESLIDALILPDPDDRHVLAAAIHARASAIVTFNLKDFPAKALAAHGVVAQSPDAFVSSLITDEGRLDQVIAMAKRGRQNLKNPPEATHTYLAVLRQNGLNRVVDLLDPHHGEM